MPIRASTPTYQLILAYRCPGCHGRGAVQKNPDKLTRTFVMHRPDCRIWRAIQEFYPKLYKTIDLDRELVLGTGNE